MYRHPRINKWILLLAVAMAGCDKLVMPVEKNDIPASATTRSDNLYFLKPDSVDFVRLIPAPPAPDTDEARADLEAVRRAKQDRTPEQIERVTADAKFHMGIFTGEVGPWFTPEELPLTARLLKETEHDTLYLCTAAKTYFGHRRPPDELRLKRAKEDKDESSYPSAHAARGIVAALIIAELAPERRDVLMERAREFGWERVIAGAHYPSDILAGRVMGQALFQAMAQNPQFGASLEAARKEFNAARGKANKGSTAK